MLWNPIRNLWYMVKYNCLIHPLAKIDKRVHFGKGCKVGKVEIQTYGGKGFVSVGSNTIMYHNVELYAHKDQYIHIGSDCLISRGTCIMTANHKV